nr:MAG TPA: hypothetical protein [Caudoviricetes sp.]
MRSSAHSLPDVISKTSQLLMHLLYQKKPLTAKG